jgi:hypothetical protein
MFVKSHRFLACGSAVLFAAMSSAAWAAPQQSSGSSGKQPQANEQGAGNASKGSSQSEAQNGKSSQAPEGFVLLDERVVFITANEPQNHFLRAHEDMATGDNRGAAAEIRIAADYLDMQASRKDEQDGQGLKQEAQSLRKLAGDVAECKSKLSEKSAGESSSARSSGQQDGSCSLQDVNEAFAAANLRLSQSFRDEANKALEGKKFVRAGHELGDAATTFEQALAWSGQKPQQDRQQAVEEAYLAANALVGEDLYSSKASQSGSSATSGQNSARSAVKDAEQLGQKSAQALGKEIDQFQQQWARTNNSNGGQNGATLAGHHETGSSSGSGNSSSSSGGSSQSSHNNQSGSGNGK